MRVARACARRRVASGTFEESSIRGAKMPITCLPVSPIHGLHTVELTPDRAPELQRFFVDNPAYFLATSGEPAGPNEAYEEITSEVRLAGASRRSGSEATCKRRVRLWRWRTSSLTCWHRRYFTL